MLEEGVSEHWASRGRSSRNLAEGEPRPRRVAGEREGISWQGPRPGCCRQGSWELGHPHPMVFGPDKPITWEGEDKDHLAKQECISIIPSYLGSGGTRGNSPERHSQDPNLRSWLPLQCSSCCTGHIPQDRSCGERGSVVAGRERPNSSQPLSYLCHPGLPAEVSAYYCCCFLKLRLREVEINQKVVGRIK